MQKTSSGGVCRIASRTVAEAEWVRTNASVRNGVSWIAIAAAARSRLSTRPLYLLLHEAAQLLRRKVRFVVRSREHAPDRTGDRAHRAPARRQLAARRIQTLQQFLGGFGRFAGQLGERLDRTARHPAAAVGVVAPQFLDPFREDASHRHDPSGWA